MLGYVLTIFHVIVAIFLILVVLLQTGKRADLAGAFGGGGSQTAFGARGAATVLSKATTAAAIVFMLTSLGLSVLSTRHSGGSSVLGQVAPEEEVSGTPTPEAPPPQPGQSEGAPAPPPDNPVDSSMPQSPTEGDAPGETP